MGLWGMVFKSSGWVGFCLGKKCPPLSIGFTKCIQDLEAFGELEDLLRGFVFGRQIRPLGVLHAEVGFIIGVSIILTTFHHI